MTKTLVINLGWEQTPLIDALAASPENELYGVHDGELPAGREMFIDICICSYFDYKKIIEFAISHDIESVISDQCDFSLLAQSMVAYALRLPGPSIRAAMLSNNKLLQRQTSKDANILIPEFRVCYSPADIVEFANEYSYPVIVKPADNRGSIGVIKVNNASQAEESFFSSLVHSRSQIVLVEEFIDGVQYSVDGYSLNGFGCKTLAIGQKVMLSDDIPVAMGISYPADLPDTLYHKLSSLNEMVNTKLGYKFGMTHSEYLLRDGQFYLVESANRGGGCLTSELIVPKVSEVDLLKIYISQCVGCESLKSIKYIERSNVTLRFFYLPEGRLRKINNWAQLVARPECLYARINVQAGTTIKPITNDSERHGFFIVAGDSMVAESLVNSLQVIYD
jgi:biotin carboxylase